MCLMALLGNCEIGIGLPFDSQESLGSYSAQIDRGMAYC